LSANVTGGFTRVGAGLGCWDAWKMLDDHARVLWITLYTNPNLKRMPGLCCGSIQSITEWSFQTSDVALGAFDSLLEKELIEYDPKNRVLRLTELPDAGEWPFNGSVLRSWWKWFRIVPECDVRDAHVATLWWLIERGAAESESGQISKQHREIWAETFGKVKIPARRRRGIRRLIDSDTGTAVQPSLFSSVPAPSEHSAPSSDEPRSVDNSASSSKPKEISAPSTVPDTQSALSGEGEGRGEGEGAGFFSSSGEGDRGRGRPVLREVPNPGPFTVPDLQQVFATAGHARWPKLLPDATSLALARAIAALGPQPPNALELLTEHVAHGGCRDLSPDDLALPGRLGTALQEASCRRRDSEAKSSALREALQEAGLGTILP